MSKSKVLYLKLPLVCKNCSEIPSKNLPTDFGRNFRHAGKVQVCKWCFSFRHSFSLRDILPEVSWWLSWGWLVSPRSSLGWDNFWLAAGSLGGDFGKFSGVHHKHRPLPWIKFQPLKIARCCPLVIQGFWLFFRVVSSDYGKPRIFRGDLEWYWFFLIFFRWRVMTFLVFQHPTWHFSTLNRTIATSTDGRHAAVLFLWRRGPACTVNTTAYREKLNRSKRLPPRLWLLIQF